MTPSSVGPLGFILPTTPLGEEPAHMAPRRGAGGEHREAAGTAGPLADLCAAAEAAGAGALWAVDHLFWPVPMLECVTTLAVAAVATRRARLGTCVLQLPLRRPAAVAKQMTGLQLLSGGRAVLGVGVGSHPGEYEKAGADFTRRGRDLDGGVAAVRRAWQEAVDPSGPAAGGWEPVARYVQAPASAPVPVWIGGSSPAAVERAARLGDGWIPLFMGPEAYTAGLERLRELAVRSGRGPFDVLPAVVVMVNVGSTTGAAEQGCRWLSQLYGIPPKAFARHVVAGEAEDCAEVLARFLEAGACHVAVMVAGRGALDQFSALAEALDRGRRDGPPDVISTPNRALVEVRG